MQTLASTCFILKRKIVINYSAEKRQVVVIHNLFHLAMHYRMVLNLRLQEFPMFFLMRRDLENSTQIATLKVK